MTRFPPPTNQLNTLRAFTQAPKATNLGQELDEPKVIREPEPVAPSVPAVVKSAQLEAAIAVNRSNTPQDAVEQRTAPRYSIREINSLSPEQIEERLKAINPSDDRPGWVKTLDLIDMPRNFIQNIITDEFVPEAKRMAMQRGEYDQAGQVKVYGSDILRAMGVENRVISAVGGFAVDVFTDPLSFIGGPIGGLKSVGTRGTAQISVKGRRTLNSAINSVRNGGMISSPEALKYINAAMDDAIENGVKIGGQLVSEADNATKAEYLRTALLGTGSRVADRAEKFGLGRFTSGGSLADDIYRTTNSTMSAAESARIVAAKEFAAKFGNNGVLDFTKGRGGAEIAHVPFMPSTTVTVPSFTIPGTKMRFGHHAVLQKAATAVREGNPAQAQAALNAIAHTNYVSKLSTELESLTKQSVDAARNGVELSDEVVESIATVRNELSEAIQGSKTFRDASPGNLSSTFNAIEDLPTLFATMDMYENAAVQARHAEKLASWTDIEGTAYRATRDDINNAKKHFKLMADEANAKLGMDTDEFYDSMLDSSRHANGLDEIIQRGINQAGDRYRSLIEINSGNQELLEKIADGFQEHVAASHHVSKVYQTTMRHAMHRDATLLADAAKMMLNLNDPTVGHLPLGRMADMLYSIGAAGASSRVRNFGEKIAVNLGGVKGNMPDILRERRGQLSNAKHLAGVVAHGYRTKIEDAIRVSDIARAEDYDVIAELAGLRLEQKMIARGMADLPYQTNMFDDALALSETKIAEAAKNGVLRDKLLMQTVDELAESAADEMHAIAKEAILRGDFDNPLVAYVPLMLKREAARRASIARGSGSAASDLSGLSGNSGLLDPTKQRITNLVHFTDADGVAHKFTIAEANAYRNLDAGTLAAKSGAEKKNAEEVIAGLEAFRKTFGTKETGDKLTEQLYMRSRPMMASEVNEYASTRRLDPITGGAIREGESGRDFFETNMVNMVYNRMAANEVARAKESLRDIVDEYAVVRIRADEYSKTVAGETAIMATGEKATNLGDGRLRIGNTTYVNMDTLGKKFGDDAIFDPVRILKEGQGDSFIPETLATEMSRVADTLNPKSMPEIMQAAERITSMFRTTTLLHPSWITTNAVGNTVLAALHGSFSSPKRAAKFMNYMGVALKAHMRRNADQSSKLKFTGRMINRAGTTLGSDLASTTMVGGGPMRLDEILRLADGSGVTGAGRAADVLDQMIAQHSRDLPGLSDDIAGAGMKQTFQRELSRRRAGRKSNRLASASDVPIAALSTAPTQAYRKAVGAWFSVNGTVDDVFRTAFFMQQLDDGLDAVSAAAATRRAMLNFGDMSSFEKNTIRPLIPFYAWMRASLPNFMMKGIKDPKLLSAVPKIQQGLEEAAAGEDRLPRHMRPRWLQETMAIQLGTDPETRRAVLAGTLLPQEGALQVATAGAGLVASIASPNGSTLGFDGNDFMEGVNWLFGQGSPALKVPIELAQGKEIFSKRDIGVRPGEGDITLKDYLLNQVRPVKEYGLGLRKGEIQKQVEKGGLAAGIGRAAIGGRLQTGLQEDKRLSSVWFDLKDRENTIKKSIRAAENAGDDERVVKLKVELLGEYKKFVEKGGDPEELPKWVRDDLARFAQ